MIRNKRIKILLYILLFIPLFVMSEVHAVSFDSFEVTWYYRNKGNESVLEYVYKNEDIPLYASPSEYVNGYTTRVETSFKKDLQYIINYELQMWFSPEQELNYRSDTIDRIKRYSYVDSDFQILNVDASETWNRSVGSGETVLTINVSIQAKALTNTGAIRFGVYTNDNVSIGFYSHSSYISYYLVDNISVNENATSSIIDQNNQIINGQNEINNSINETNSQLGDLNDNITDDNVDNNSVSDAFNEFEDFIDENSTISSLITLPVTLFTSILNGLQNSCSPFNLGSLYGESLVLPCIDISSYLGNTLWTMIDIIISGFAIYFISQKFIKVFNNFSSMKEGDVIDD